LWKEVDGTRTCFLYSDEGLAGEYDAAGTEIKTYGWAPDSTWGTDPLFVKTAGAYYWYQNDHAGTPQKIISTSGSVVWSAVYDSFGNCQVDTGTIVNNLRLAGQYFDAETGLHYNWNRYYDPKLGRYLNADPLGDGLNLYAYCFNNPNTLIDPMGLCAVQKNAHNLLALAGMVPALGIIPDLLDSGLYLMEGDYANASMASLAAIPFVGDFARGGQYLTKTFKYLPDIGAKAKRIGAWIKGRLFRASKSTKPRFIADEAGNIVDTHATPPGRYIQPDKSATDILQDASHPGLDDFTSRTHTHDATVHVNPNDPTKGTTKLSKHPRSVTTEEVKNIMDGTATRSTSRGH